MKLPLAQRRQYLSLAGDLLSPLVIAVGIIGIIIAAVLLFIFLFGAGGQGKEPGSGRGDSSGGGRNDDIGFGDGYEPPEGSDFDFAVMMDNKPLRTWTFKDVEKLDKRKVSVPGEGDFEGTSLIKLIDESGEDDWEFVSLLGSTFTTFERDDVDDDWILIFVPPDPATGAVVASYTLVIPDRPRSEWPDNLIQFDVSK